MRIFSSIKSNKNWLFLILLSAIVGAYFNCLHNEFLWDDEFLIQKNKYLDSFSYVPKMLVSNSTAGFGGKDNFYRPTQNIYYLLINQLFGRDVVAFHIGNILIHILNALLIFFLILSITKKRSIALITSLIWGVHPTHTEAVTYISGTADPLSLMFCLLCLLSYPYEKFKISKITVSLLFFILALISKEAIIVTPALLCLMIFIKNKKILPVQQYISSAPYWITAFIYLLIRKTWLNFDNTYSFYKESNIYTENILYRAYTFIATLPEYVIILFNPTDLHMERSFPVHTLLTAMPVILGLLILLFFLCISFYSSYKKRYYGLFCTLWFFSAFVPMMGILVPVNSFILEHWLYVPSISLFFLLALIIDKTERFHKYLPYFITFILTIPLIYLTQIRNKDWSTPISFYTNILEHTDGSARIHNNLAMALSEKELWQEAIEHYQIAIKMSDTYPQTHYNLARAFINIGQYEKALLHLDRSLNIQSDFTYSIELKQKVLNFLKQK